MDLNCQIEELELKEVNLDEGCTIIDNFLDTREDLDPYVKIQLDSLIKNIELYKNKKQ